MSNTETDSEHIFIGVAWPYANGPLHLGTVVGCLLPADIFGRYHRMRGNQVLMVSGSDEHGTPITLKAEKEGVTPRDIADRYNKQHVENIAALGIELENFSRTSGDFHRQVVQDFFLRLHENGYIFPETMESPYCEGCGRFLPDRYVEGTCPYCGGTARGDQCDDCGKTLEAGQLVDPRCKLCGETPVMRETEHLFFELSAFQQELLDWLADKDFWRSNVITFTRNWVREGLEDRAVTRDLEWGIPVPLEGYEDKRLYVWFEAVMGYLSASQEWAEQRGTPDAWRDWWQSNARHYYFLAKDNIPFHTIIWPAMLLAHGNLALPYDVPANEYLTFSGEQFSKSKGIGVWIPHVLERFAPDAIRYYLSINMPEKHDTDWNWPDFQAKTNNELVGTFGNFVHRVLTFTATHFGEVPQQGDRTAHDEALLTAIEDQGIAISEAIEAVQLKQGMKELIRLAQRGNQYLNEEEPWNLIQQQRDRCATVLHISLRLVKALAIYAAPYLPHAAQRIWDMLGQPGRVKEQPWDAAMEDIAAGTLPTPTPLFDTIDVDDLVTDATEEDIGAEGCAKLNLRVAEITQVRKHPHADRLYVLDLDVGELGGRRIVAGIRPWYDAAELEGRRIVIVVNLKPAIIRGVRSQGMLLAADDGTPSLLVANAEAGHPVAPAGVEPAPVDEVDIELLKELSPEINENGVAVCGGHELRDKSGTIRPDRTVDGGTPIH